MSAFIYTFPQKALGHIFSLLNKNEELLSRERNKIKLARSFVPYFIAAGKKNMESLKACECQKEN